MLLRGSSGCTPGIVSVREVPVWTVEPLRVVRAGICARISRTTCARSTHQQVCRLCGFTDDQVFAGYSGWACYFVNVASMYVLYILLFEVAGARMAGSMY
eukprot:7494980-Pyramimonas_sp.AAC.1